MSPVFNSSLPISFGDWREYRRNWGWLLALGVVSIILGLIALVDSVLATIVSMIWFGWVLLIAGIVEAVQAFRHRRSGHVFLHSLNAVLSFVMGLILLRHPLAGALVMTLLLAAYFTVTGIFRIVNALTLRLPSWGWALANGVITLILGILVWAQWPISGLWIIGLFIGIHLIFTGWAQVMLASAVRKFRLEPA
ncbi:MAG: HdeD family acid-resistance protein [Bryobacteraceae bacterium]